MDSNKDFRYFADNNLLSQNDSVFNKTYLVNNNSNIYNENNLNLSPPSFPHTISQIENMERSIQRLPRQVTPLWRPQSIQQEVQHVFRHTISNQFSPVQAHTPSMQEDEILEQMPEVLPVQTFPTQIDAIPEEMQVEEIDQVHVQTEPTQMINLQEPLPVQVNENLGQRSPVKFVVPSTSSTPLPISSTKNHFGSPSPFFSSQAPLPYSSGTSSSSSQKNDLLSPPNEGEKTKQPSTSSTHTGRRKKRKRVNVQDFEGMLVQEFIEDVMNNLPREKVLERDKKRNQLLTANGYKTPQNQSIAQNLDPSTTELAKEKITEKRRVIIPDENNYIPDENNYRSPKRSPKEEGVDRLLSIAAAHGLNKGRIFEYMADKDKIEQGIDDSEKDFFDSCETGHFYEYDMEELKDMIYELAEVGMNPDELNELEQDLDDANQLTD